MPRNRTGASAGRRPHPAPSIRSPLRRRFRRGAIQPRIRVMGAILGTVLLLFAARLVQIQGFNADDYAEAAANLRLTTIEIPTVRGDITDMAGRPFAMSVEVRTVFLDPAEVRDDQREEIVQELSRRFDLPPEEIVAKLNARVDGRPSRYEVVQRGVPIEEWKEIRELGFHGVSAERDYKRVYRGPAPGGLSSGSIGYRSFRPATAAQMNAFTRTQAAPPATKTRATADTTARLRCVEKDAAPASPNDDSATIASRPRLRTVAALPVTSRTTAVTTAVATARPATSRRQRGSSAGTAPSTFAPLIAQSPMADGMPRTAARPTAMT